MAVKKQFTASLPVQLTPEWRDRLRAVADHEAVQSSIAAVIRDCIAFSLPGIEIQLGLLAIEDLTDEDLANMGLERTPEESEEDQKEDRSRGCFGGPPALG